VVVWIVAVAVALQGFCQCNVTELCANSRLQMLRRLQRSVQDSFLSAVLITGHAEFTTDVVYDQERSLARSWLFVCTAVGK
jgi:hypothetical protein